MFWLIIILCIFGALQDQFCDLSRKTEEEKQVLTKIISDNESTIANLKQCVNVEVEAKEAEKARIMELNQQMQLLQVLISFISLCWENSDL